VAVSECFCSSETYEVISSVRSEKIGSGRIFRNAVAFSKYWSLVESLSQGAGELGPLGVQIVIPLNIIEGAIK